MEEGCCCLSIFYTACVCLLSAVVFGVLLMLLSVCEIVDYHKGAHMHVEDHVGVTKEHTYIHTHSDERMYR